MFSPWARKQNIWTSRTRDTGHLPGWFRLVIFLFFSFMLILDESLKNYRKSQENYKMEKINFVGLHYVVKYDMI